MINTLRKSIEYISNGLHIIYRGFHIESLLSRCHTFSLFLANISSLQINLVSNNTYGHIFVASFTNIIYPSRNATERCSTANIEHNESSSCIFIVPIFWYLKYPIVTDLNCYWPAVSQICILTFLFWSICMTLEQYSIPTVGIILFCLTPALMNVWYTFVVGLDDIRFASCCIANYDH